MASALPLACLKSNAVSLLAPPPLILLLLLLLFSLLIAFTVLHVAVFIPPPHFDLISSFLPPPDFLSSFLFQGLSCALHLQHHYLGFLLSPFPIFILANVIVFTLLLKGFYPSSHSASDHSIDQYALPEHFYTAPSHGDFYLPSDHQLCSPEDYHVLSLTNYIEEPPMQDYINMPYVIKGASQQQQQQQIRKPHKEEAQAKLSSKKSEVNLAKMGQERAKGPSKGRSDREPRVAAALPSSAVAKPSIDKLEQSPVIKPSTLINQHEAQAVVVINVETVPHIGCAGPPPPSQQIIKQTVAVQRPVSAAKATEHQNSKGKIKDMQAVVANDGKETLRAKDSGVISAKQAKNHDKRPKDASMIPPNPYMARSHSDHRLSQRASTAAASADKSMQRARSMKSTRPLSHFQPITSSDPPALTSLDGLSDDEANKRFSDFIANRFALMKREFLECT